MLNAKIVSKKKKVKTSHVLLRTRLFCNMALQVLDIYYSLRLKKDINDLSKFECIYMLKCI
jgi:hypothetical protein